MIVDDDPATQRVLSVLIEVEDMLSPTDQAYSGAEALHHVATRCPDVIICDVNMPGMSGMQALPLLRQACPDAVIALYSSHPMARTRTAAGRDAVFDKSSTDPSVMLGELLRLARTQARRSARGSQERTRRARTPRHGAGSAGEEAAHARPTLGAARELDDARLAGDLHLEAARVRGEVVVAQVQGGVHGQLMPSGPVADPSRSVMIDRVDRLLHSRATRIRSGPFEG